MLRLTYGQDWGHLVDGWWPLLAQTDPFDPVQILVPHAAAGRWLRLWVAERRGIASHWRTRSLEAWMQDTVPELLDRVKLRDHFVEALHRDAGPKPIAGWLEAARTERDLARRRLQLAGRLADGLIDAWSDGVTPDLDPPMQAWVDSVVQQSGGWPLPEALRRRAFHRDAEGPLHVLDALPPRRGLARAVAQAAEARDVHILASNPCAEFWEDLPRAGERSVQAEFDFTRPEENPLLIAWGQAGRPLVRELDGLSEGDFEPRFLSPAGETTLQQIQREVLERRAPAGPRTPDDSLDIVVLSSLDEEARSVAAGLRRSIAQGLQPFELGVVLAGDDGAFRAALEAELPEVPLFHLDRRVLDRSPLFDAARRLWRLDEGVSGAELQDILLHPNIALPLDADERALAVEWVGAAGMLRGLNTELGWRGGAARLALGLLGDREDPGRPVPTSDPDVLARFIGFIRRLGRVVPSSTRRADRGSWMKHFHRQATQFLRVQDERDERDLGLLMSLVADRPEDGAPVWTHDMAWQLLEARMSGLRRPEGPSAGVALGRLGVLARRPLARCWIAQIDDRHFPRRRSPRPFGLPSPDGPSEDRFELLLRVMNTRDQLCLSWAAGPDGERGSAAAAELGGPPARTQRIPEPARPAEVPSPPSGRASAVRQLRPEDLVHFLLDPFEAWLRVLHGPPRPPRRRLEMALDFDVGLQRPLLERALAHIWPDDPADDLDLDALGPGAYPPVGLAEAGRSRLVDTLNAWQDHLHAEGLPTAPMKRRASPALEFEAWTLRRTALWVVEGRRWCRIRPSARRAGIDALRAEAFVHHGLANAEDPRATAHYSVDGEGARRIELGAWTTAEARAWLEGLGRALIFDRHDVHLPMDSAWALWEVREQAIAERRRAWSRLRLRADPRAGLRILELEEAEARVRESVGEVARRCL